MKILGESGINYTFLDTGSSDIKLESKNEDESNVDSNVEKYVFKKRTIDSKKSKTRYKNRITGGQNQQGHSSVYE
jgi:hypothetical protein